MSSRRLARELALQALFGVEVGHREPAEMLEEVFKRGRIDGEKVFVRELVLGTLEHASASDARIGPLLEGWTIERLPTIDRLLMRMGVYELEHTDMAAPIVINEAVELAKKFSTENSGRFVNGVLSAVAKQHG